MSHFGALAGLGCLGYIIGGQLPYLVAPLVFASLILMWIPSQSSVEKWLARGA